LIIKDFNRQNILSPDEVAMYVNALPRAHLRGLQTILYKPVHEFRQLNIPIDQGCKGAFFPEFQSIIIFNLVDKSLAPHIIYHEIGHYVFHRVIDSYIRKEWTTRVHPFSPPTSVYGGRNAVEDFAETYAVYARDPRLVAKNIARQGFMRNKIFTI
jgi:hypothetical protein